MRIMNAPKVKSLEINVSLQCNSPRRRTFPLSQMESFYLDLEAEEQVLSGHVQPLPIRPIYKKAPVELKAPY
jgi:hypothetical protein